jgi:hypothetical protein
MEDEVAALVCTILDGHSDRLIALPFRLLTTVLACAKLAVSCICPD